MRFDNYATNYSVVSVSLSSAFFAASGVASVANEECWRIVDIWSGSFDHSLLLLHSFLDFRQLNMNWKRDSIVSVSINTHRTSKWKVIFWRLNYKPLYNACDYNSYFYVSHNQMPRKFLFNIVQILEEHVSFFFLHAFCFELLCMLFYAIVYSA